VEEIQIWTDVDGLLTCDPRVFSGGYRLRQVSYVEASTMAASGAKVLHPDSVTPAVRQQIPLVVRNSRRPHADGTWIVPAVAPSENIVKGIAVIQNLLLLAIRPPNLPDSASMPDALQDFLQRRSVGAAFVKRTTDLIYAGFQNVPLMRKIEMELKGCVEGRVLTNYALITLIGTGAGGDRTIVNRAAAALKGMDPIEFHIESAGNCVSLAVPQRQSGRACELLHREFFSKVDANFFAPAFVEPAPSKLDRAGTVDPLVAYAIRKTRILTRTVVKGG
jgi:aspartate kinase